jgi:hypothetical protein
LGAHTSAINACHFHKAGEVWHVVGDISDISQGIRKSMPEAIGGLDPEATVGYVMHDISTTFRTTELSNNGWFI